MIIDIPEKCVTNAAADVVVRWLHTIEEKYKWDSGNLIMSEKDALRFKETFDL